MLVNCCVCRVGKYLNYEYGLLGKPLNTLMSVEDGTMCGDQMACYNGSCLTLNLVRQQMVKKQTNFVSTTNVTENMSALELESICDECDRMKWRTGIV